MFLVTPSFSSSLYHVGVHVVVVVVVIVHQSFDHHPRAQHRRRRCHRRHRRLHAEDCTIVGGTHLTLTMTASYNGGLFAWFGGIHAGKPRYGLLPPRMAAYWMSLYTTHVAPPFHVALVHRQ